MGMVKRQVIAPHLAHLPSYLPTGGFLLDVEVEGTQVDARHGLLTWLIDLYPHPLLLLITLLRPLLILF